MTERVTLITGASAGIGTELARVFASHGHRLALVARRADRLEALAAEITAAGGAAPIVIPCDLAQPDSGDRIDLKHKVAEQRQPASSGDLTKTADAAT